MNTSTTIYLDYAAATPLDAHVLAAMQPYFSDMFFNPSSPYAPAVQVRRDYEAAKQRLAESFGAKGDELIMTAGATESINLAFTASRGHMVSTAIEHQAVFAATETREASLVQPEKDGTIRSEAIIAAIRDDTDFVSVGLANSELGTIQPIREIARSLQEVRQRRQEQGSTTPLFFHVDASQGFGQIDIHVARLGVDFLTLNAGKIYGPKQVGLLWTKNATILQPQVVGGGQERGMRSGTENVAGVIGFAEAAVHAARHRGAEAARLQILRDNLETNLAAAFPSSTISGAKRHRLPGHLHISFPAIDAERVVFLLEMKQILVATGSACAANKQTASHVLQAIGLEENLIRGSLRLTLGKQTTKQSIDIASAAIIEAVKSEYARMKRSA